MSDATHQAHVVNSLSFGDRANLGPPAAADPVSVTVGLSIIDAHFDMKINSDERRRVTDQAVVTGWMTTEWTDPSLAWSNDTTRASRRLRLDNDIWLPDIRHLNTIGPFAHNLLTFSDGEAVVDPSGKVLVQSLVQLTVRFLPREGFTMFMVRLGSRLMTTAEMDLQPAGDEPDMGEYSGWYVNSAFMRRNETSPRRVCRAVLRHRGRYPAGHYLRPM